MRELGDTTKQAAAWIGWRRSDAKGCRWKPVCEGATEAEAFRRLLEVASRQSVGSFSNVVLPAGEKP